LEVTEYCAVTVLAEPAELVIVSAPVIVVVVIPPVVDTAAPVLALLIPPVPQSISIPPAALDAAILTAPAVASLESRLMILAQSKVKPVAPLQVIVEFPVIVSSLFPPIVLVEFPVTSSVLLS